MCVLATNAQIVATNLNQEKAITELSIAADDGWEDWIPNVTAMGYNLDGTKGSGALYNCKVERRMSCGEREYRIHIPNAGWYPVSKSPISGYSHCVYYNSKVYCFNM